jgi:mannan endo-1,6-alpha-mannosidase
MRAPSLTSPASLALLLLAKPALSIDIDVTNAASILSAAKVVVGDILQIYTRNGAGPAIPGLLPAPYYWYEAGMTFDSLINYWSFSGDASVVAPVQEGILFQVGPDYNFMPPNQSKSLGNDDQSTWALAAMTAAETGFPTAPNQSYSWLQLAQRVFDGQAARWDTSSCNGGLRWQIYSFNNGYDYKNSISTGNLFQLAARLAKFTGNQTYVDWAQKSLDWSQAVGLVSSEYSIFDGADDRLNCTEINHVQWSHNAGTYLRASSYLANSVSSQFRTRTYICTGLTLDTDPTAVVE